jgi:hypothetical protein
MRIKVIVSVFILFVVLCIQNVSVAQNPTYALTAKNFDRSAPDSLTFEVYVLHTNAGAVPVYQYALGQYFFNFNTNIANGGTLTYRILDSGLPENLRPRNPQVNGSVLRLAVNTTPGPGNGYNISSTGNGTLIVKMSLKTSAASLNANESLNLEWINPPTPGFVTKLFAYVNNVSTDITTPGTHNIIISVNQISTVVPEKYEIYQNYPNPFNPSTKIKFDLPNTAEVKLTIFDISGRELSVLYNGKLQAGSYEYKWEASSYASGVYFYRLVVSSSNPINAGQYSRTMKMMLIK